MRAVIISVGYAQTLSSTLPWNRHHFDECMIVTTPGDDSIAVAEANDCATHQTTSFYDDGAYFAKYKAMEEALDVFGRHGRMAIIDADIAWPKVIPDFEYKSGCLYTPRRRMCPVVCNPILPEEAWSTFPVRDEEEFAGYTQIFWADDPVLTETPWHQTNWIHAGGGDSFFQQKWSPANKVRPPFDVLHMGPCGKNWCGIGKTEELERLMKIRMRTKRMDHEKL